SRASSRSSLFHLRLRWHATVQRSGDDFHFELLFLSDRRGVVTNKSEPAHLREKRNHQRQLPRTNLLGQLFVSRGRQLFIKHLHNRGLLFRRRGGKPAAKKRVRFAVGFRKPVDKSPSLFYRSPLGQNQIDKLIHFRTLRSRCIGRWNHHVAHRHHDFILLHRQRAQPAAVPPRQLRPQRRHKQIRRQRRKNTRGSHQT